MQLNQLFQNPFFVIILIIWSLAWKGYALWTAAQRKHATWFALILLINTAGILEILYLVFFYKFDFGNKTATTFYKQLRKKS